MCRLIRAFVVRIWHLVFWWQGSYRSPTFHLSVHASINDHLSVHARSQVHYWQTWRAKWAAVWQNQQNDMCVQQRQISLDIHPIWSEFLLSAWKSNGSLATQWGHSEDSDQTGQNPRLICLRWAHMSVCWFCHAAAQMFIFIQILQLMYTYTLRLLITLTFDLAVGLIPPRSYFVNFTYSLLKSHISGYKQNQINHFNDDMNPALALLADWIITSGNTGLAVDMLCVYLEKLDREDVVEVIQKAQGR